MPNYYPTVNPPTSGNPDSPHSREATRHQAALRTGTGIGASSLSRLFSKKKVKPMAKRRNPRGATQAKGRNPHSTTHKLGNPWK